MELPPPNHLPPFPSDSEAHSMVVFQRRNLRTNLAAAQTGDSFLVRTEYSAHSSHQRTTSLPLAHPPPPHHITLLPLSRLPQRRRMQRPNLPRPATGCYRNGNVSGLAANTCLLLSPYRRHPLCYQVLRPRQPLLSTSYEDVPTEIEEEADFLSGRSGRSLWKDRARRSATKMRPPNHARREELLLLYSRS